MVHYQDMFAVTLDNMARAQASISNAGETRVPYGVLLARLGQESISRFR